MYLNANLLNYGTSDVDIQSFNTHPNITQYCMQSTLKSFGYFVAIFRQRKGLH